MPRRLLGCGRRGREARSRGGGLRREALFWLLDDLVDAEGGAKLFLPSEGFTLPSVPRSLADYLAFCERTIEFVTARNERIRRLGL
jgi:hypothetical protein